MVRSTRKGSDLAFYFSVCEIREKIFIEKGWVGGVWVERGRRKT